MGQILLLSVLVTAFYEKYLDSPAQQLSLVLRLNHRKFPAPLVAHVLPLLTEESNAQSSRALPQGEQIHSLADQLAKAFVQWEQAKSQWSQGGGHAADLGPFAYGGASGRCHVA